MTTVIAKRSIAAIQEADSSMAAVKETNCDPNSYEAALVALGKLLLKDDDSTDWMSARKVSGQCLKHWKHLSRIDYSARRFSDWAGSYFSRCGEIRGKDVKVEHKTEPSSHRRRDDLFLRFCRLNHF